MEGHIFCYSLDDNIEILKDKSNTEKNEIIVRQLGTTERLLNLLENTKVAEAQGNGFWEMYTLDETLSDLVAHKAQQHKEFHNEPITQEVLNDIIGNLKNRLTESYAFLKSEYKVVKRQLKNSPSTRRKTVPDIFNTDIPNYIQSLIDCILIDSSFVDLDFINDVASLNNLLGKRTKFQNDLELETMDYCLRLMEKGNEFSERKILENAKDFIRTRFKVGLNYTFAGDAAGLKESEAKAKTVYNGKNKKGDIRKAIKELKLDITTKLTQADRDSLSSDQRKGNRDYVLSEIEILDKVLDLRNWEFTHAQKRSAITDIKNIRLETINRNQRKKEFDKNLRKPSK